MSSDAMTVTNPFAALARKWELVADHSPEGERIALHLMVADLWKTIAEEAS